MASTRRFESLQLNCKTRVYRKPESFACCEHRVPAFFRVIAPLRAFDEGDLSVAKAEGDRRGGLFDVRDDPPPLRPRFLGSILILVFAGATSGRGRFVQTREHPVPPI